jgi:hypothetical protein
MGRPRAAIGYLLLIASFAAHGGLDIDQYMPPAQAPLETVEAMRQKERVAREQEEAQRQAAEQARRDAAERARLAAELAARPHAVRLIEQRCLGCHDLAALELTPRTRLGWEWVTLRMQWLNGAELERGERSLIAAHLAQARPAPTRRVLVEYLALALVAVLAAWQVWRRWHRAPNNRRNQP